MATGDRLVIYSLSSPGEPAALGSSAIQAIRSGSAWQSSDDPPKVDTDLYYPLTTAWLSPSQSEAYRLYVLSEYIPKARFLEGSLPWSPYARLSIFPVEKSASTNNWDVTSESLFEYELYAKYYNSVPFTGGSDESFLSDQPPESGSGWWLQPALQIPLYGVYDSDRGVDRIYFGQPPLQLEDGTILKTLHSGPRLYYRELGHGEIFSIDLKPLYEKVGLTTWQVPSSLIYDKGSLYFAVREANWSTSDGEANFTNKIHHLSLSLEDLAIRLMGSVDLNRDLEAFSKGYEQGELEALSYADGVTIDGSPVWLHSYRIKNSGDNEIANDAFLTIAQEEGVILLDVPEQIMPGTPLDGRYERFTLHRSNGKLILVSEAGSILEQVGYQNFSPPKLVTWELVQAENGVQLLQAASRELSVTQADQELVAQSRSSELSEKAMRIIDDRYWDSVNKAGDLVVAGYLFSDEASPDEANAFSIMERYERFYVDIILDSAGLLPVYSVSSRAPDLFAFDSLNEQQKQLGSIECFILLSNDLDLSGLASRFIPVESRYGSTSDGIHEEGFAAVYGFFGQYTTEISFGISGKNKFTDVIADAVTGGTAADGTLDLYLTSGSNGDAFFLHDAFSEYHKDVETRKDVFGRNYAARVENINSIFAGDADDIIDLTTTESTDGISGGGVKNVFAGRGDDVVLGSTGNVFGEDGNDTLISHHSATMTGGNGKDIFGFLATPAMQDSVTGVISEPVHKILDFEMGVDSIKFYVSSDLESTGSMQTGNSDHITKTADGDIEWMYFHAGATSKTMTVEMNGRSWSMDDIEFVTYTPITPELV